MYERLELYGVERLRGSSRVAWLVQVWLLLLALPLSLRAQIHLGDTSTTFNGLISTGYSADFGNKTSSDHNWLIGGTGNFSGSYHNPNFLSYNGSVFLNQSRANSNYQSISNTSGFVIGTNIFNGSHFPGAISYSKSFDSEGNYNLPGYTNFVTHGNNDTLNINWNESLPGVPTLTANYMMGSGNYTVYGTNDEGGNKFRSLSLHSSYNLDRFATGAFYTVGNSHAVIPEIIVSGINPNSVTDNDGFGFNVGHPLPLQGMVSLTYNRSSWNTTYLGIKNSGTIDLVNTIAAIHPNNRLSMSMNAAFSDNLSGQVNQSVIASGGTAIIDSNQSSNSLDLLGVVSYSPASNVQTSAQVERRTQLYLGESYGVTSYGGGASYSHTLFDGSFNASLYANGNTDDNTGDNTVSFSTNENYSNTIEGWHVNALFSYAQNVQTLLVTYMNSFYNFSGNARRKWGAFSLNMGAGGSRTGLTSQAGTVSSSQSYHAGFAYGALITATGNYSRSSGQALATGAGLVTVTGAPLPSSLATLYGGESESVSVSSAPSRGLLISTTWARSHADTSTSGSGSTSQNNEFNSYVQYQVRKLYFNSGYSRLTQGFGGSDTSSQTLSSYYFGVSRWFNFF